MLTVDRDIVAAQEKLSKVNAHLFEFAGKNPDMLDAQSFKSMDLNDKLFVLQPWPTFVNQEALVEFKEAGIRLFDLIKSLPKRLFQNDPQKISAYYEIPESLAKLHLDGVTDENLDHLLGRADFFLTQSGLKCLEYNITSNLGGLYMPMWEVLYLNNPVMSRFLDQYGVRVRNKNLIQTILEHILESIPRSITGESKHREIVLVVKNYADDKNYTAYLNRILDIALQMQGGGLKGNISICDYHQLSFKDKTVYYKGVRVHAMIEMYLGLIPPEVQEVFKAGNIALFNGPVTELMSNKLNLALLSDYHGTAHLFSDQEKRIIDKYVPWSRKITPGETTYRGEVIRLEAFLLENKNKLVIKSAIGYGGSDIHIGPKKAADDWEKLVGLVLQEKCWLVQEFVDHLPGLYQTGEKGCEAHDIVWGIFAMGKHYGGAWARVVPKKSNKGTINCHQGAKVSVIFEVDE